MRMTRIFVMTHFLLLASITTVFSQTVPVNGQITRINQTEGKIAIGHEPIPNLSLDSMSNMVIPLADPSMLSGLKVGDRIVFEANRVNGRITITKITKMRK